MSDQQESKSTPQGALPNLAEVSRALEGFQKYMADVAANIQSTLKPILEFKIDERLARQISAAVESFNKLPDKIQTVQEGLAKLGWFAIPEMPISEYLGLEEHLANNDIAAVDQTMSKWTEYLLGELENELCRDFPDRETFIREGFDSHKNGKYASAITLLLSQADGICYECFEIIFFTVNRNTGKPYVADKIEALDLDALTKITLHPLLVKAGINSSEKQRENGEFLDSPNRHLILHGKDKLYPTRINSLKVISFITFMGSVGKQITKEDGNA